MFNDKMSRNKCTVLWLLIIVHSSFQYKKSDCRLDYQGKYEYTCPDIHIFERNNFKIEIVCKNQNDGIIDEILDEIDIGPFDKLNIKKLEFIKCQLIPSFPKLLRKFNISNLESLNYEYVSNSPNFSLSSETFNGLEGIKELDLISSSYAGNTEVEENGILTSDTFKHLRELRYISLIIELETLPIGVFDNLHYLETLLLPSNSLDNLDVEVFKNLKNLQRLDLNDNYLEELPEDIFRRNINLESVTLNNNILTLPNNLFANLSKLAHISLIKCEIDDLPENLFHGSNSLNDINLSWNFLQSLPENIFEGLNALQRLDLSNNKIRRIGSITFDPLRSLVFLSLADNELDNLTKHQFRSLKEVEIIHLYNNNLTTVPITIFQETINLKEINLANNSLKTPYKKFGFLLFNNNFNMEVINLSKNNLTFFNSDYISSKSKLTKLDLRYNKIESISIHNFQSDANETVIDLRNNKIVSIDFNNAEEVLKNRSIVYKDQSVTVKLDYNPLQCDCFSYNFLKYFANSLISKFIKIKADNLKCSAEDTLAKNVNLKTVGCSLDEFSLPKCSNICNCYYRPWDNSVVADCENKNLTDFPKIILPKHFRNVEEFEINLKNNLLTSGPNVTLGYEAITKLFLSSNNITEISWLPPKLKVLELSNNDLRNFNEVMITQINSSVLHTITLGNNPWNCDCSSLQLYEYLLSNKNTKRIDISNITCERYGNKSMIVLNPEELCLTEITYYYITFTVCLMIILIICITIILYHYHEDKIKVWLYVHNMCMWFVTEEELDKEKIYDAFISYSYVDENFILKELQPFLESGPNPYKLCLHIRDWIPGKEIAQQINYSIENSRRTLVILSSHFLESIWGTLEFRTAHSQAMKEGRARVILVVYGDLNLENLDGELKDYIKTNTYIKWGDPWFWNKLRYALPHRK